MLGPGMVAHVHVNESGCVHTDLILINLRVDLYTNNLFTKNVLQICE